MKNYIKYLPFLAIGLLSCEPEFDDAIEENEVYTAGEADFSNYVSLGNSLTAGFADNALYIKGQQNSYPNILAGQFKLLGGGEFTQPLMADNLGGLLLNGVQIANNRLVLSTVSGSPAPAIIAGTPQTEITNKLSGPFNNMGVPGAKSFHLAAPGYGAAAGLPSQSNPYFVRFSTSETTTVLADAVAQNPSFFSLWIGNNDILGYATSGGTGVDQAGNLDPSTYGSTDITDPNVFGGVYNQLINELNANASGGVVYNIPNVTDIPFFTTVPNNALVLDAASAGSLTGFFQAVAGIFTQGLIQQGVPPAQAQALAAQYAIAFNEGPNRFVIDVPVTQTNPLGFRQMQEGELILLTINRAALAQGYGSVALSPAVLQVLGILQQGGTPTQEQAQLVLGAVNGIDDKDALDSSELSAISNARLSYNSTIQSLAEANGLAFVDADALLNRVGQGISFPGGIITSDFVTGGGFSLDGVHLTPRGYALIANETLEAINQTYGSNLPKVNVGEFGTISLSDNVN
ncbi:esterase/lipase, SGNH_hydrolase superfamily [Psychroflexus torquis ATCC 700755]|uniref:Esterase/lipase, SGNH_hydrolase superfamily n=1 Tax=Psychroflexus torquis (strain ATCC 700755 / CIP 106069 / ACAM 623) TaxID=313595 RepID=K4IDR9_PSYTT|nr:esterase [Psychroflexus torquis]AFU68534.1 esterase/lipase, SGNH_hydrolase superfamily [Psychroflexus torquis ATCC 700755]